MVYSAGLQAIIILATLPVLVAGEPVPAEPSKGAPEALRLLLVESLYKPTQENLLDIPIELQNPDAAILIELRNGVQDSRSFVRARALNLLARIGRPAIPIASVVAQVLVSDSVDGVRNVALTTLARINPTKATAKLIGSFLSDENSALAAAAADALRSAKIESGLVPLMLGSLNRPEAAFQQQLVLALGRDGGGSEEIVSALAVRLTLPNNEQRIAALDTIGTYHESLDAVWPQLFRSNNIDVRMKAAETIGRLGPAAVKAIPQLEIALSDPNPFVAAEALNALVRIGPPAVPALLDFSLRQGFPPGAAAPIALRKILAAHPTALDAELSNPKAEIRGAAATTLLKVLSLERSTALILINTLADATDPVRRAAGLALIRHGISHLPFIEAGLKDERWQVRMGCAIVLGEMGAVARYTAPTLAEALSDERLEVRQKAAQALGKLGPPSDEIVALLIKALGDSQLDVQWAAAASLSQAATIDAAVMPTFSAAIANPNNRNRAAIIACIGKVNVPVKERLGVLIPLLGDASDSVRSGALASITAMGAAANEAVPTVLPMLKDGVPAVRLAAVKALAVISNKEPALLPSLAPLSADSDEDVRLAILHAWIPAGATPAQVRSLLTGAINDQGMRVRKQAMEMLRNLGDDGISTLADALLSESVPVRAGAFDLLKPKIKDHPELIPALERVLEAGKYRQQELALRLLKEAGAAAEAAVPTLVKILRRNDVPDDIHRQTLLLIGELGSRAVVAAPTLLELGRVETFKFRSVAFQTLGRLGTATHPMLMEAINDVDTQTRIEALKGMGMLGPDGRIYVPSLVDRLNDETNAVKEAATSSLIRIGEPAAEAMLVLLKNGDKAQRQTALKIIGRIGGPAIRTAIPDLMEHLTGEDGADVMQLLLQAGAEAAPPLLAAMDHANPITRERAVRLLGAIKPPSAEAIAAIVKALGDAIPAVRQAAIFALKDLGAAAPNAVPALRERLKDENRQVQRAALAALGEIGGPSISALVEVLGGDDTDNRLIAARFLAGLSAAAEPFSAELGSLATDPRPDVREASVKLLAGWKANARRAIPHLLAAYRQAPSFETGSPGWALERIAVATPEAVPALIAALDSDDKRLLRIAVQILGGLENYASRAIVPLIQAAKRELPIRQLVRTALCRIGPPLEQDIEPLATLLNDPVWEVRELAALAVKASPAKNRDNATIGRALNELAAVGACRSYWRAQKAYRRVDWDNDGVVEYARALSGNHSLIETAAGARDLLLVEPEMSAAEGLPGGEKNLSGYRFIVLTGLNNKAYGTDEHGLIAYPAVYGDKGTNTFVVTVDGKIYGRDLGEKTHTWMTNNPALQIDDTWKPVSNEK